MTVDPRPTFTPGMAWQTGPYGGESNARRLNGIGLGVRSPGSQTGAWNTGEFRRFRQTFEHLVAAGQRGLGGLDAKPISLAHRSVKRPST